MSYEPEARFRDIDEADRAAIYNIRVRVDSGVRGIRDVAQFLKTLLRGYRIRCLSVTEERPQPTERR
jgi:hypothetical protein